ncbi:two-component regulator propeller domain-containing protein [Anaerophaga thermohalophila]|uniref:two-component regulator propeller domain-containing protein n=1 Tax=Anaerophaga thermohalophila TaxID=177400 RepID=UPI000237C8CD|nr:two-component regulator propeller domain-containing protein [Anaerophaga thermohalophila]
MKQAEKNIITVNAVFFVFAFFISQFLSAEIHELKFERLNMEDGLNHNSVNCFLHSSNGFLWIGTFEGINVFDGYKMESFQADPMDDTSLSNNFVECMLEDSYGNIWVGTQNGLNLFVPEKQEFIKYYPDSHDSTSICHNVIKTLYQDSEGFLWIGTYGGGLSRYDYDDDTFTNYTEINSNLPCNFINTIFEDRDGVLWLGTWQHGVVCFSKEEGIFENFMIDAGSDDAAEVNTINAIIEKRRNVLWLGTWGHGIMEFNIQNHQVRDISCHSGSASCIQDAIIKTILPISSNEVLAGSFGNGLFQIITAESISSYRVNADLSEGSANSHNKLSQSSFSDGSDEISVYEIEQYNYQIWNDNSISNNWIWSIYQDNSGLCWVATWGDGINKIDFYKNRFKTFYPSPVDNNNFFHYQISAAIEITPGVLLIGTVDGGFYQFFRDEKVFINLDESGIIERAKGITTFERGEDSCIWVGTREGLFQYNPKRRELMEYKYDNVGEQLSGGEVSAIHSDRLGHVWVGFRGKGIDKLIPIKENPERYIKHSYRENPSDTTRLPSNTITAIYCDNYDNIWIGTLAGGVCVYDRANDRFKQVSVVDKKEGIILKDVLSIFESEKGELWLGTLSQGLWHFDKKTSAVVKYSKKEGLSNNAVHSILEDREHNLWLATGYGISKFNPETKNFINFQKKDGLHGNNFNFDIYSAVIKMSDNSMFFGGKNGFTIFSPEDIRRSTYIPKVVINGLTVNGKEVEAGDTINGRVLISKPLYATDKITLTSHEHLITFEFASLHFATPLNNSYEYTLEGFDGQWFKVDASRRFASYTNLPPGEYIFRVKASNSHGIWHPDSHASLEVIVLPPFWKTPWFIILISLPFFILGYYIYKSRTRYVMLEMSIQEKVMEAEQIIREKELLKQEQEKLTNELDQKNKALVSSAMAVEEKNQRLKRVKNYLSEITPYVSDQARKKLENVYSLMEENSYPMEDWKSFETSFDVLHNDFLRRITETFPKITHKDLRLVSYIRMNYSNKEIAEMLNISLRSVESSRYRLRKKMNLASDINLNDYIIRF